MLGKLFKKLFKNLGMTSMTDETKLQDEGKMVTNEPLTNEAIELMFSLGGKYASRDISDIYRRGTNGEEDKGLPIVAIKNISIMAGGYDIVDTGMAFELEGLNVTVAPSFDLFTNMCDIFPAPIVPIHDATKRTKTGVNVGIRNVSSRPINIKAGTVIGYFNTVVEVPKTILNTAV